MRDLMTRIRTGSALLWWSGVICVALTAFFGLLALLDPAMITGARRWSKPAKFAVSFVFYFWTLAWMLPVLLRSARIRRFVAGSAVCVMAFELMAIVLQVMRGVPSHFNGSTAFNAVVYAAMGVAISTNTLILLGLATFASFAWKPNQSGNTNNYSGPHSSELTGIANAAERAGIICGLWLIVVGSVFGILISVHGGHSVGGAEDGAGLPAVGWKFAGGDLRVAHFLGLHGFQMAPLAASLTRSSVVVYALSATWVAAVVILFRSAMAGVSIWPF